MKLLHRLRLFQLNSLTVRLILFLLIALVPVGLIAVLQTRQVGIQSDRNAQLALIALTEQTAKDQEHKIRASFAAAHAFGTAAALGPLYTQRCQAAMQGFVARHETVRSAAFLMPSGQAVCVNKGNPFDLSVTASLPAPSDAPRRVATLLPAPAGAREMARQVELLSPLQRGSDHEGYIRLVLDLDAVLDTPELFAPHGLVKLVMVSQDGEIVSSSDAIDLAQAELPATGAKFDAGQDDPIIARNVNGEARTYAAKPVLGGAFQVIGIWDQGAGASGFNLAVFPLTSFALLMWVASLLVAIFAVHNLVIRHVRSLGREMRRFAKDRTMPAHHGRADMPIEMQEMTDNFHQMAVAITHDEAALESSVREKKLLLKEVHHRVKNNLQLISSIINMQIRRTQDEDTQFALRRVQDRVLSLATIHRDLYESDEMGHVNGGKLLHEIIDHSLNLGGAVERDIQRDVKVQDVWLIPDQAVPLSLFAAEAVTNALKYIGAPDGKPVWLRVRLERLDADMCELEISNSISDSLPSGGTGLGAQLISAFATQLGGDAVTQELEQSYRISIRFAIKVASEATDY